MDDADDDAICGSVAGTWCPCLPRSCVRRMRTWSIPDAHAAAAAAAAAAAWPPSAVATSTPAMSVPESAEAALSPRGLRTWLPCELTLAKSLSPGNDDTVAAAAAAAAAVAEEEDEETKEEEEGRGGVTESTLMGLTRDMAATAAAAAAAAAVAAAVAAESDAVRDDVDEDGEIGSLGRSSSGSEFAMLAA